MTPLSPPLGSGDLTFWRLDQAKHAGVWRSGEGSWRVGGRWNSRGVRAVYAALDTVPHVLTRARIADPGRVHVVNPADVPDPNWLRPGALSAGQQRFGDELLKNHAFVFLPSVVSAHSWNVVFDAGAGLYDSVAQEPFVLDARLHPARGR